MGRFDGSGDLLLQKNASSLNTIQNHSDQVLQQELAWTDESKSREKNVNEISGRVSVENGKRIDQLKPISGFFIKNYRCKECGIVSFLEKLSVQRMWDRFVLRK